jgi:hypothetical protein
LIDLGGNGHRKRLFEQNVSAGAKIPITPVEKSATP